MKILKLLDLNVCIKLDNNKEVVQFLNNDKYDIVTLQEVMRKIDDTVIDRYKSSNVIKENTNYKYSFFGPLWIASHHEKNGIVSKNFGGNAEQGNEIFTNYPIKKCKNTFYYKDYSIFEDTTNFRKEDHSRAFLSTILDINGKDIQVITVHGIWTKDKMGDERTLNQIESILEEVRYDIPCIVTGDFNLLPKSESIKNISQKLTNLIEKYDIKFTRPSFDDGLDKGDIVCDYIFVNDKVKINDFKVINTNVSDHLPIVLDFDI